MQPVEYTSPTPRSCKSCGFWGSVGLLILYFAGPVLTVMFVVQPVRIEGRAVATGSMSHTSIPSSSVSTGHLNH
jgi:hypothetical protein